MRQNEKLYNVISYLYKNFYFIFSIFVNFALKIKSNKYLGHNFLLYRKKNHI